MSLTKYTSTTECTIIKHFVFSKHDDDYDVVFSIITPEGAIIPGYAHRGEGNVAGEKSVEATIGNIRGGFLIKFKDWQENDETYEVLIGERSVGRALAGLDWLLYLDETRSPDTDTVIDLSTRLLARLEALDTEELMTGIPTHIHHECEKHEKELRAWIEGSGEIPAWTNDIGDIRARIEATRLSTRHAKDGKPVLRTTV